MAKVYGIVLVDANRKNPFQATVRNPCIAIDLTTPPIIYLLVIEVDANITPILKDEDS